MENKEKQNQEIYMEFQALEQHIKQLQGQLEMVTQQLMELSVTNNSLDELNSIKTGKEIFVPISSGIFAKANISSTTELLVNVGANVVVQKDVPSTKKLILQQIEEIKKVQMQFMNELDKMTSRASELEMELQKLVGK